jgi:hypothetical protein
LQFEKRIPAQNTKQIPNWLKKRHRRIELYATSGAARRMERGYVSDHVCEMLAYQSPERQWAKVAYIGSRKERMRARCNAIVKALERAREVRAQDFYALGRAINEGLRRIESKTSS